MTPRLLRTALVLLILAALAAAGWTVVSVPSVREHVAEAFNAAGEAYIRFVFRLYQLAAGRGDGADT